MPIIYVNVHLKNEILDPQGRAVCAALIKQGLSELVDVRQGKQFRLALKGELTSELTKEIEYFAQNLLINPVIEDYSIEVKNES